MSPAVVKRIILKEKEHTGFGCTSEFTSAHVLPVVWCVRERGWEEEKYAYTLFGYIPI